MRDYAALIAKLDAATEGSRELDYAIWQFHFGGYAHPKDNYPAYTSSLDAALTLKPQDMMCAISIGTEPDHARLWSRDGGPLSARTSIFAPGKTPALALCLACISALKAREATP